MYKTYHNVTTESFAKHVSTICFQTHGTRQKDAFRSHRVCVPTSNQCAFLFVK